MARNIEIKPIVKIILIALAAIVLILFVICVAMETARSRTDAAKLRASEAQIMADYKANIAKKTDAYMLAKNGLRQLDLNLSDMALITLARATQVQPNYRDGWLALGLAQLKTGDIQNALISFQAAEKLDPIYAKTYELLKIAYEKLEDTASAKKAEEKWVFLTKK